MSAPNPPLFSKEFFRRLNMMADSVTEAFRFKNLVIHNVMRYVLAIPSLRFVYLNYRYEHLVHVHQNVQVASDWLLSVVSNRQRSVIGAEQAPKRGPLLVLCNHAGMGDALLVHATLPRTDIYTVVYMQGLLLGLPNFSEHCLMIDRDNPSLALRQIIRMLRDGKTVLLFPRGEIEDDPGLNIESALQSVDDWSQSIELVGRQVPELVVMPVAVGGVISRRALNFPVVKLYPKSEHRNFFAATLQGMVPFFKDPIGSIMYGTPLSGEGITLTNVQTEMRRILQCVHDEQTEFVEAGELASLDN